MLAVANYMEDFISYYERAKILNERNAGMRPAETLSGCPLQDNIPIYDTIWRRYAGFSKALEDLWHGPESPGKKKAKESLRDKFVMEEWLYIFLVHRCTGSGASFETDHGYRNSIVIDMAERHETISDMAQFVHDHPGPMFTSIGNQPPPFNKPEDPYKTAGKQYLHKYAPALAQDVRDYLFMQENHLGKKVGIRELTDWVLDWHSKRGMKKYFFVMTAFVMDIAEYFPEVCDRTSLTYLGANAQRAMDLIFLKEGKAKRDAWLDAGMNWLVKTTGGNPYDIEDVLCDFIRYKDNYIPPCYVGTEKGNALRVPLVLDIEKQKRNPLS